MSSNAPLVVFVSHAEQCLSALNNNFLAPETDLFLF